MQKQNAMLGKTHVRKWNGKKREKEGKEERKWVWGGQEADFTKTPRNPLIAVENSTFIITCLVQGIKIALS